MLKIDPKFSEKDYKAALTNTFFKIDELLVSQAGREEIKKIAEEMGVDKNRLQLAEEEMEDQDGEGPDLMGCTANVLLIKDNVVYVANAGDSRSIAIMKDGKVEELSSDHKPEKPTEMERIKKAGGCVFNGRVNGNLNLSRALGDLQYKKNKALEPKDQAICALPISQQKK